MYLIEALCCVQLHGVWWIYLLGQIIGAFLGAGVRASASNQQPLLKSVNVAHIHICSHLCRAMHIEVLRRRQSATLGW